MFGTIHIISLFITIIIITAGTILSLKLPLEKCIKILLFIGILSEAVKIFTYILMNEDTLGGYLPKTDLPFQLCSIQILFIIILYLSKNENLKRIIRSFMLPTCLVGGLAAILIPTSSSVGTLNILTFQYFGYHAVIMIFALRMLIGKDVQFTIRDYATSLVLLFAMMFFAVYINSMLYNGSSDGSFIYQVTDGEHVGEIQLTNVNFMYVANPPQSGLPFLNENHGWGVYFVHYTFTCLFAITSVYLPTIIKSITPRKRSN